MMRNDPRGPSPKPTPEADWKRLGRLHGVADVRMLRQTARVELDLFGAPPFLDIKVFEDHAGRFYGVPSHLAHRTAPEAMKAASRPGTPRPAAAKPSVPAPEAVDRLMDPYLEPQKTVDAALEHALIVALHSSPPGESIVWEPNPLF